MNTERLLQIKDWIDEAKTKQAELKGKLSGIREQMRTGFEVKDLPAAEKKLEGMANDLDKMEAQFDEGMTKLENAYDWGTSDSASSRTP